MKITPLFTGKDEKSYFKDVELKFGGDQKILTTDSRPATMAIFRCVPPGTVFHLHPAPRRRYLVTISGSWEIETSSGTKRLFKAGDVMLADDTTRLGHTSPVLGNEPHIFMTVPLAD